MKYLLHLGQNSDLGLPVPRRAIGPRKWCKTCGRNHPARETCHLVVRVRKSKSGKTLLRWVHVSRKDAND